MKNAHCWQSKHAGTICNAERRGAAEEWGDRRTRRRSAARKGKAPLFSLGSVPLRSQTRAEHHGPHGSRSRSRARGLRGRVAGDARRRPGRGGAPLRRRGEAAQRRRRPLLPPRVRRALQPGPRRVLRPGHQHERLVRAVHAAALPRGARQVDRRQLLRRRGRPRAPLPHPRPHRRPRRLRGRRVRVQFPPREAARRLVEPLLPAVHAGPLSGEGSAGAQAQRQADAGGVRVGPLPPVPDRRRGRVAVLGEGRQVPPDPQR